MAVAAAARMGCGWLERGRRQPAVRSKRGLRRCAQGLQAAGRKQQEEEPAEGEPGGGQAEWRME